MPPKQPATTLATTPLSSLSTTFRQLQDSSQFRLWCVIAFVILFSSGITFTFSIWFRNLPFFSHLPGRGYTLPCATCRVLGPELSLLLLILAAYPIYQLYLIYSAHLQQIYAQSLAETTHLCQSNTDLVAQNSQLIQINADLTAQSAAAQHELGLLNDDDYLFAHRTIELEFTTPNLPRHDEPGSGRGSPRHHDSVADLNTSFSINFHHQSTSATASSQQPLQSETHAQTYRLTKTIKDFVEEFQKLYSLHQSAGAEYKQLLTMYDQIEADYEALKSNKDDVILETELQYQDVVEKYQSLSEDYNTLQHKHGEAITDLRTLTERQDRLNSSFTELAQSEKSSLEQENGKLVAQVGQLRAELNFVHATIHQYMQLYNSNIHSSFITRAQYSLSPHLAAGATTAHSTDLQPNHSSHHHQQQQPRKSLFAADQEFDSAEQAALNNMSVGSAMMFQSNPQTASTVKLTSRRQSSLHKLGSILASTSSSNATTINGLLPQGAQTPKFTPITPSIPSSSSATSSSTDSRRTSLLSSHFTPQIPKPTSSPTFPQSATTTASLTPHLYPASPQPTVIHLLDPSTHTINFNSDQLTAHRSPFSTTPTSTIPSNSNSGQPGGQTGTILFTNWKPQAPASLGYILEPVPIDEALVQPPYPLDPSALKGVGLAQTKTIQLVNKLVNSYQDQQRKTEAYIRVIIKDVNHNMSRLHSDDTKLKTELETLHHQLSSTQSALTHTKEQIELKNGEIVLLKAQLSGSDNTSTSTHTNDPAASSTKSSHEYELDLISLSTQLHDAQTQREMLETDYSQQSDQLRSLETRLNQLQEENAQLQSQLLNETNIFEDEKETVMTNFHRLEAEFNDLGEKHSHLSAEFVKLSDDYTTLQDLYEQTHVELNVAQSEADIVMKKYAAMKEQYNVLQSEFNSIEEQGNIQQMHIISQLQEQTVMLQQTNHEKEADFLQAQRTCKNLQNQLQIAQSELTSLRGKISNSQFTIQSLEKELAHTKQFLTQQDQLNTSSHQANSQATKQLQYDNDILASRVQEKQEYIDELLSRVDKLEQQIHGSHFESTQIKNQLNESILNTTMQNQSTIHSLDNLERDNKELLYKYKKSQKDLQLAYETQDNLRKEINVLNTSYQNDMDYNKNLLERSQLHLLSQQQHQSQQSHLVQNSFLDESKRHKLNAAAAAGVTGNPVNYDPDRSFLDFTLAQLPGYQAGSATSTQPRDSSRPLATATTTAPTSKQAETGFQTPTSKFHNRTTSTLNQSVAVTNTTANTTSTSQRHQHIPDSPISSLLNSVMSPMQVRPAQPPSQLNKSATTSSHPPHPSSHPQTQHPQPSQQLIHNAVLSTTVIPQPPQRHKPRHSIHQSTSASSPQDPFDTIEQDQPSHIPETPHHHNPHFTPHLHNPNTFMSPFQSIQKPNMNANGPNNKRRQTYQTGSTTSTTSTNSIMKMTNNNNNNNNNHSQASTTVLLSPTPNPSNHSNSQSVRSMASPSQSTASSASNTSRRSTSSTQSMMSTSSNNGFHRVRLLNEDPDGVSPPDQQQHGIRISHPDRDILFMQSPIKHGDVLLSIANVAIQSPEDYSTVVNNNIHLGQPFFVVIRRDNAQVYTYSFTVEGKNDPQPDGTVTFKKKIVELSNRVATNSFFDCRPYHHL